MIWISGLTSITSPVEVRSLACSMCGWAYFPLHNSIYISGLCIYDRWVGFYFLLVVGICTNPNDHESEKIPIA